MVRGGDPARGESDPVAEARQPMWRFLGLDVPRRYRRYPGSPR